MASFLRRVVAARLSKSGFSACSRTKEFKGAFTETCAQVVTHARSPVMHGPMDSSNCKTILMSTRIAFRREYRQPPSPAAVAGRLSTATTMTVHIRAIPPRPYASDRLLGAGRCVRAHWLHPATPVCVANEWKESSANGTGHTRVRPLRPKSLAPLERAACAGPALGVGPARRHSIPMNLADNCVGKRGTHTHKQSSIKISPRGLLASLHFAEFLYSEVKELGVSQPV